MLLMVRLRLICVGKEEEVSSLCFVSALARSVTLGLAQQFGAGVYPPFPPSHRLIVAERRQQSRSAPISPRPPGPWSDISEPLNADSTDVIKLGADPS